MLLLFQLIEDSDDQIKAEQIYHLYYGTMFYTALRILHDKQLAEDAVSEGFIRIIKNLDKISEIDCYRTRGFAVIIVRNIAIDILRKRNTNAESSLEQNVEPSDGQDLVFEDVTAKEMLDKIVMYIPCLKKNYADVLYLKLQFDYSYDEIGKVLGISPNNAKMRMSRARQALKKLIEQEG